MRKNYNYIIFILFLLFVFAFTILFEGCSTKNIVEEKPGALLWGENCVRCHNAPSPQAFSDNQWETITMHMKVRANLTTNEVEKIVEFLQMAN